MLGCSGKLPNLRMGVPAVGHSHPVWLCSQLAVNLSELTLHSHTRMTCFELAGDQLSAQKLSDTEHTGCLWPRAWSESGLPRPECSGNFVL